MRNVCLLALCAALSTALQAGEPLDEFIERDIDLFDEIRPEAATNDRFGWSSAVVPGFAFVGALMRDPVVGAGGLALYSLPTTVDTNWTFEGLLEPPVGANKSVFGRDVAAHGEWMAVNNQVDCPQIGNNTSGVVYLFRRDLGGPGNWGLHKALCRDDPVAIVGGALGSDIDATSTHLIVGNELADVDGESDSGAAYIYERDSGDPNNWGQVAALRRPSPGQQDRFGQNVGIHEDVAVVGAPGADLGTDGAVGVALVFHRDQGGPNQWGFVTELRGFGNSAPEAGDDFGRSVDVWDNVIVVGSGANDTGGSAHIFYRDSGGPDAWGEVLELTPAPFSNTDFSTAIELRGQELMVGSIDNKVWLFHQNAGGKDQWGEIQLIEDLDTEAELFGRSVSFFNGFAVVGDSGHDNTPDTVNGVGAATLLFDDVIFRDQFDPAPTN